MICVEEPVILFSLQRNITVKYYKNEVLEILNKNEKYLQK